jgi:3-phosphoshikimate 1-carboxyvinyltransferase
VPGDWSSLGYLLLLAWASGGAVAGADLAAAHPDRAMVRLLRELGVSGVPAAGVRATAAECPDLLPTLAALACVCPGSSVLEEVHLLRGKESDRLEGIRALVDAAGGRTELSGDTLTVSPPPQIRPFSFSSRGDHRMAMSAAVLAVLGRVPLTLAEPDCVSKSFPGFFQELAASGARLI